MSFTPSTPPSSLPPTTTAQQDITHEGQRKINLIWEVTQAIIAIVVVLCNMAMFMMVGYQVSLGKTVSMPEGLTSAMFLIIGFYFSRTNHSAIGGVGNKADTTQEYKGR
jgi:hypothetical protein